MTWHATSQLTTVAHPTSPHNQPPYFISPHKQLHDVKTGRITTMEQQKPRSQQRNGLGTALVGRLRTFYRQILSLPYSSFSLLKLPPPARPGTTCTKKTLTIWIYLNHSLYGKKWFRPKVLSTNSCNGSIKRPAGSKVALRKWPVRHQAARLPIRRWQFWRGMFHTFRRFFSL